jgi:SecD/SecF fusion protein
MKHVKLKFFIGIVLLLATVMTSCTTTAENEVEANYEVLVRIDVSQVITEQAIDPNNEDFLKVYHAAIVSRNESNSNFVDVFFEKCDSIFPNRNYIEYFKVNIELANDDSNKGVKKYFLDKRKELTKPFVKALSDRLKEFGVVRAELIDKEDRVKVGVVEDVEEVYMARLIMSNAKVQFLEVYETYNVTGLWYELEQLSSQEVGQANDIDSSFDDSDLVSSEMDYIQKFGSAFKVNALHKESVDRFLNSSEVKGVLPEKLKFMWSKNQVKNEYGNLDGYILYPCKFLRNGKARVDQDDIDKANFGSNSETGEFIVNIEMTQKGSEKWAAMTGENAGRIIAICLNDLVISAPMVLSAIHGGYVDISDDFTEDEAKEIASLFSIGNLPLPCLFVGVKKL